jgi:hypothetical protein
MPLANELVGEVGNDSFSPAVEQGRHAFDKRTDLGDLHRAFLVHAPTASSYNGQDQGWFPQFQPVGLMDTLRNIGKK